VRDLPGGAFVSTTTTPAATRLRRHPGGDCHAGVLDPQNPDLVTKIRYPSGRFLEYAYENGRRTRMTDQDGLRFGTNTTPRAAWKVRRRGKRLVTYHYDPAGRVDRQDHGNGTFTTYEYDAPAGWSTWSTTPPVAPSARFDYVYDELGRRSRMTTLEGQWTTSMTPSAS
jgi:YD repeat-containing protein